MSMLLCSESGRAMFEPAEVKAHIRKCQTCRPLVPRVNELRGAAFDSKASREALETRARNRAERPQQPERNEQPASAAA